jgi:hypothetical protein
MAHPARRPDLSSPPDADRIRRRFGRGARLLARTAGVIGLLAVVLVACEQLPSGSLPRPSFSLPLPSVSFPLPSISLPLPTVRPSPTLPPATATLAPTAVPTQAPTASATAAPTAAPTAVPTAAPTASPTPAATAAPTATRTPAPTATATAAPSATASPAPSPSPSPTPSPSPSPTATEAVSPSPTETPGGGGLGPNGNALLTIALLALLVIVGGVLVTYAVNRSRPPTSGGPTRPGRPSSGVGSAPPTEPPDEPDAT